MEISDIGHAIVGWMEDHPVVSNCVVAVTSIFIQKLLDIFGKAESLLKTIIKTIKVQFAKVEISSKVNTRNDQRPTNQHSPNATSLAVGDLEVTQHGDGQVIQAPGSIFYGGYAGLARPADALSQPSLRLFALNSKQELTCTLIDELIGRYEGASSVRRDYTMGAELLSKNEFTQALIFYKPIYKQVIECFSCHPLYKNAEAQKACIGLQNALSALLSDHENKDLHEETFQNLEEQFMSVYPTKKYVSN